MEFKEFLENNKARFESIDYDLRDLFLHMYGEDEIESLETHDVRDKLDYSGSLHELIDSRIDIYYYDIRKWAVDNWEYVEQAIEEGLTEGESDYHKLIQTGQYVYFSEQMHRELEEMIETINELIGESEAV